MRTFLAALALAILAACSTTPTSPQQSVYAIQGAYASALTVAVAYKNLPPCGRPASPVLCADAAIVTKLQRADDAAYPALQAAQEIVRTSGIGTSVSATIDAAQRAVSAFVAITQTLHVR